MGRRFRVGWLCTSLVVVCAIACGGRNEGTDDQNVGAAPPLGTEDESPAPVAASRPRVVVLGDSLTAGLGVTLRTAYPSRLQDHIADAGFNYTIVNAGVSGDTSAGGLSRLEWALDGDVRVLIVALGGNDALRGLPPGALARNLSAIIERAQARRITVILAGMEAPPNYGFQYVAEFHKVYPALAKKYNVALVPFLLEGVGGVAALNQPDGIHPTAQGAQIVADNVWRVLKAVLEADSRRVARERVPGR